MENISSTSDIIEGHTALVNDLTTELGKIRAANEIAQQKNADLWTQIVACERRQEYIDAALAEGERIASEITSNAKQRIEKIIGNAQNVLVPQHEQIACIEHEIEELNRDMTSSHPEAGESAGDVTENDSCREEYLCCGIEARDVSEGAAETNQTLHHTPNLWLAVSREFSLQTSPDGNVGAVIKEDLKNSEDKMEAGQPEQVAADPQLEERREFSLREPQDIGIYESDKENREGIDKEIKEEIEDKMAGGQPEQVAADPQLEERREFSLREPQDIGIDESDKENREGVDKGTKEYTEDKMEASRTEPTSADFQPEIRREFSLREPQEEITGQDMPESQAEQCEQQSAPIPEYAQYEPPAEEISNYNLAMSLVEQNDNKMDLDVFVDIRYHALGKGGTKGDIQKLSWQVKMEVELPANEHVFVGYGKISSTVTSTLLRYDDVILNDVFPFDLIEPTVENIAMYFYNCVHDDVSLLDITLREMTIWEKQNLIIKVSKRNEDIDNLVQKGEDLLEAMRNKLAARDKEQPKPDPFFKSMLGKFKKQQLPIS